MRHILIATHGLLASGAKSRMESIVQTTQSVIIAISFQMIHFHLIRLIKKFKPTLMNLAQLKTLPSFITTTTWKANQVYG